MNNCLEPGVCNSRATQIAVKSPFPSGSVLSPSTDKTVIDRHPHRVDKHIEVWKMELQTMKSSCLGGQQWLYLQQNTGNDRAVTINEDLAGQTLCNLEFCRLTESVDVSGARCIRTQRRKRSPKSKENRKSGEREKVWGRREIRAADSAAARINPRSGAACRGIPVTCRTSSSECFGVPGSWTSLPFSASRSILSSFNSAQCPASSLRSTRCSGCRARLGASLPSFMYADLSHGSGRTV